TIVRVGQFDSADREALLNYARAARIDQIAYFGEVLGMTGGHSGRPDDRERMPGIVQTWIHFNNLGAEFAEGPSSLRDDPRDLRLDRREAKIRTPGDPQSAQITFTRSQ